MASVKLQGFDREYKKLKSAHKVLSKQVPIVLGKYGAKMVKHARQNHKPYGTKKRRPTGNLERAITFKVNKGMWLLDFYIDPSRVTSGEYNYAWIQHDGSGQYYKKSRFSPAVSPKLSRGGVKPDHFMVRAWDKYVDELTDELTTTLKKALQ